MTKCKSLKFACKCAERIAGCQTMTSHTPSPIYSRRHIKWLCLCLLLTAVASLLGSGCARQEADLFLPVESDGLPAGLTLTGPPLQGIDVRVRGSKSALANLSNLKLRYSLDLSDVSVGVNKIAIDQKSVTLPKGISVVKVHPAFITLRVEKEIKKELPVVIAFAGRPASGYLVADAVAKPLAVTLRGPKNLLDSMEKILTKPVDLSGRSESFKKEIALDLAEEIEVVAPAKIVHAEILIAEKIVTRNYSAIPVIGKDTPYPYEITPPEINIEVKGPLNVLEKLDTENGINVYVELKGLKPGVYVRRATITLPVKTTLMGVKPEIFTVKIKKP